MTELSPPIVYVYTGARWSDFPGRQFMLTRALARHHKTVYLEFDARTHRFAVFPHAEIDASGVILIHDALRLRATKLARWFPKLANAVDSFLLHRLLKKLGITDYVYWVSSSDTRLLPGMKLDRMVFDCIDPCFSEKDDNAFDAVEREVVSHAKLVFATAHTLKSRMDALHSDVVLVPNGAPDDGPPGTKPPASIPGRGSQSRPVVGYMGTLDWRFDAAAIERLASDCPEVTICLAGRVNQEQRDAVSKLSAYDNVVVTGSISREQGEAFISSVDVGLIPFRPGAMNDAINPCKLYMHLWAGAPIVATNVRECRDLEPMVLTETPNRSLADCVRQALQRPPSERSLRQDFARQNTWGARARQALDALASRNLLTSKK